MLLGDVKASMEVFYVEQNQILVICNEKANYNAKIVSQIVYLAQQQNDNFVLFLATLRN